MYCWLRTVDVPSARCVLCALGSFPVVSEFNCIPPTPPLSLSLLCTLHGLGTERTDIHSSAAASSSVRAIASARRVTSGGEGGSVDWGTLQKVFFFFLSRAYRTAGRMFGNSNQSQLYRHEHETRPCNGANVMLCCQTLKWRRSWTPQKPLKSLWMTFIQLHFTHRCR